MVKELKKELSKLSGIDFFNPKYRDVFKKYFPDDTTDDASESNDNEEGRLNELIGEDKVEDKTEEVETNEESSDGGESAEDNLDEKKNDDGNNESEESKKDDDTETKSESETKTEDVAEDNTKTSSTTDGSSAADMMESNSSENTETTELDVSTQLLETKVELELYKAGVRADRIESARKLIMCEIHSLDDLDKVKEIIKQYPEWLNNGQSNNSDDKSFGAPFGDGTSLTNEEKRLQELCGI